MGNEGLMRWAFELRLCRCWRKSKIMNCRVHARLFGGWTAAPPATAAQAAPGSATKTGSAGNASAGTGRTISPCIAGRRGTIVSWRTGSSSLSLPNETICRPCVAVWAGSPPPVVCDSLPQFDWTPLAGTDWPSQAITSMPALWPPAAVLPVVRKVVCKGRFNRDAAT